MVDDMRKFAKNVFGQEWAWEDGIILSNNKRHEKILLAASAARRMIVLLVEIRVKYFVRSKQEAQEPLPSAWSR